jgi:hypothetical protein
MKTLTIAVKHVPAAREQPCDHCGALFSPAEDSGSRVLSAKVPDENVFGALLCGGCYSKWAHGLTVSLHQNRARS